VVNIDVHSKFCQKYFWNTLESTAWIAIICIGEACVSIHECNRPLIMYGWLLNMGVWNQCAPFAVDAGLHVGLSVQRFWLFGKKPKVSAWMKGGNFSSGRVGGSIVLFLLFSLGKVGYLSSASMYTISYIYCWLWYAQKLIINIENTARSHRWETLDSGMVMHDLQLLQQEHSCIICSNYNLKLSSTFTLFSYFSFLLHDYPCVDHMIIITSSPFYFPYHSDVPPYLCPSHSDLISLLSQNTFLIVLCFHLSSYPHNLLSIWLSLYLLHSVLLFYIPLSSYWTFYFTYLLALFLIVIPTKFRVFLTFLLVDSLT